MLGRSRFEDRALTQSTPLQSISRLKIIPSCDLDKACIVLCQQPVDGIDSVEALINWSVK